jgi:iron-sulfur cluster repair protein YtfE (RIC family)
VLQIRTRATDRGMPDGPAELLLACHTRIREFTALAARLASQETAPDRDVADAAARVHRYYAVALPLHQADEEESIAPRLVAVAPEPLREAIEAMKRQHVALDDVAADLLPLWEKVAREPGRRADLRPPMEREVGRIQVLWAEHLAVEEQLVFPAVSRLLDAAAREQIAAEMRARRTPSGPP